MAAVMFNLFDGGKVRLAAVDTFAYPTISARASYDEDSPLPRVSFAEIVVLLG